MIDFEFGTTDFFFFSKRSKVTRDYIRSRDILYDFIRTSERWLKINYKSYIMRDMKNSNPTKRKKSYKNRYSNMARQATDPATSKGNA